MEIKKEISRLCNCRNSAEILEYLGLKGKNHVQYRKYSKLDHIKSNIKERALYLSDGSDWNDEDDRTRRGVVFSTCFSYAITENIALWMLYGGNGGKTGAMVSFSKKQMHNILETETIELLAKTENGMFVHLQTIPKVGFDIEIRDILYYSKEKSKTVNKEKIDNGKEEKYLITRAEEHSCIDKQVYNELTGYLKDYAWSYEKETRMIVMLKGEYKDCIRRYPGKKLFVKISTGEIKTGKGEAGGQVYKSPVAAYQENYISSSLHVDWDITE